MIWLFRLSVAVYLVCLIVGSTMLPDQVPVRFDADGDPTMLRAKSVVMISMLIIGLLLAVVFEVLVRVVPARGGDRLGLPYRDHWIRPQNEARFRRMIATDVAFFGICTMSLLSLLVVAAARAGEDAGRGLGRLGVVAVLGFALGTLTWLVWMFTSRYRPAGRR
ncbi:putative membrane protein [Nocardioides daedukensis]|uniref:Putative membrane protein n=1 Tax=Nocardioides daedukensis TaxID=634462 RepID=A0A7Y9UTP8_9ACTN|nr:hypothetical protein [Nocardioides daedukensis]NYG58784.1 putative membrane protein [Nocardioides daedukensis]